MKKEIKQTGIANITNFSVNKKVVTLKIKFRYENIVTSISLLQTLNTDVTIHAKVVGQNAVNLGVFTISSSSFDKDGNATIVFKSILDSIELDNVCDILGEDDIKVRFKAVLEIEEKEE